MTASIRKSLLLGALALSFGCASAKPIPTELADARTAYNRAAAGPCAELAPAQLHTARTALDKAEKVWSDEPESVQARDLAYVASRKAQMAESIAGAELAKQQRAQAEKSMQDSLAQASADAQEELLKAREQLAKAQLQAKEALTKLSGLKDSVKEDERGLVITLSGAVLFPSNKASLLPAARTKLDEIARALVGAKSQNIVIEGYTDATGKRELNDDLSQRRAQSVASYLASKGIQQDRIQAVGRGPERPIAENETPEGRASNRRVEIVVQGQAAAKR